MPTEKRQRQKEGRAARQAALEASRRRAARRRQLITLVVVAVLIVGLLTFLSRGGDDEKVATTGSTTTTTAPPTFGSAACPNADGSSPRTTTFTEPPQQCIDRAATYTAAVETDVGAFTIALDAERAPLTVNNFVFLARFHFYDGLTFHRAPPDFVVQGGDPEGTGSGGPGYTFADELPKSVDEYKAGSLAMANSGANTNGSQFFVVVSDNGGKSLQSPNYSLFGQVTEGLDVVQKINADGAPDPGPPKTVHKITKVTITEA